MENEVSISSPGLPLLPHQQELWEPCVSPGFRGCFKKWHRGAGKDVEDFSIMVDWALRVPENYWYIFPEAAQGRRAVWNNKFPDGRPYLSLIPGPMIKSRRSDIMLVELWNGSTIQILGAKDINRLRGARPFGVVISEYAYHSPLLLPKIILPMVIMKGGWVLCNTTPIGHNHAYDMRLAFEKMGDGYYTSVKTIKDTGMISEEEVERQIAAGLISREDANAEYYCAEEGSVKGAYLAEALRKSGYGQFPHDPSYLVYTLWDLAAGHDSEVIWFWQYIDRRPRFIDYYEGTGMATPHYAGVLKERGYGYGMHFLPHDAAHRKDDSGSSFSTTTVEKLAKLDIRNVEVIPRTSSVLLDIDKLRVILPMCDFDREHCDYGYRCLQEYHADWNPQLNLPRDTPKNDWAAHAASAMRGLPAALDYVKGIRGAEDSGDTAPGYDKNLDWWKGSGEKAEYESVIPSDLSELLK
jgi:hypothetical protein